MLSVPVDAGAAHAVTEDKGTVLPIRGGDVIWRVADRDSLLGQRLPKISSYAVFEFVCNPGELKIGRCISGRASLERYYRQARVGERLSQDRAGPAIADDDGVHALLGLSHRLRR